MAKIGILGLAAIAALLISSKPVPAADDSPHASPVDCPPGQIERRFDGGWACADPKTGGKVGTGKKKPLSR